MQFLIKYYLAEREQYINFCGYDTTREKVDVGVLKGSRCNFGKSSLVF